MRAANKGTSVPAESTEGTAGTKGNPRSQSTHRTQRRAPSPPTWGAAESGVERLWGLRNAGRLASGEFEPQTHLETEVGYGLTVSQNRGIVTPYAGLSLAQGGHRTWRAGTRWNVASSATLGLEAARDERGDQEVVNAILFNASMRW